MRAVREWIGPTLVLLALILIFVINRAYFGWTIQLYWPWAAILAAADKIDRQLRKFKERLTDRRVHGVQREEAEEQTGEPPEEEAVPEGGAEDRG